MQLPNIHIQNGYRKGAISTIHIVVITLLIALAYTNDYIKAESNNQGVVITITKEGKFNPSKAIPIQEVTYKEFVEE